MANSWGEKKRPRIFTKEFWKEYKWQNILINMAIYLGIFAILLLIDLLTKKYLYDENNLGNVKWQSPLLGIRSILHKGTTIEIGLTIPGLHTVSIIILLLTLAGSMLLKRKIYIWLIPGLAAIAAGACGNMVDRFIYQGVRDVFFIPWADTGTFNFADVCLIFGAIGFVVSTLIISLVEHYRHKKVDDANEENNTNTLEKLPETKDDSLNDSTSLNDNDYSLDNTN